MAKLDAITKVVMDYASTTTFFITPHSATDPLLPKPKDLPEDQFQEFFFEFLTHLHANEISAKIPLEGLKACRLWANVCILVLHFQN
jgi:hypothetical protein